MTHFQILFKAKCRTSVFVCHVSLSICVYKSFAYFLYAYNINIYVKIPLKSWQSKLGDLAMNCLLLSQPIIYATILSKSVGGSWVRTAWVAVLSQQQIKGLC